MRRNGDARSEEFLHPFHMFKVEMHILMAYHIGGPRRRAPIELGEIVISAAAVHHSEVTLCRVDHAARA